MDLVSQKDQLDAGPNQVSLRRQYTRKIAVYCEEILPDVGPSNFYVEKYSRSNVWVQREYFNGTLDRILLMIN